MAEFDFDELDKAVTSLMQKQTSQSTAAQQVTQDVTAETQNTVAAVDQQPMERAEAATMPARSVVESQVDSRPQPTESAPTAVSPRRGKFMDVVRPGAVAGKPAQRPVTRSGATLQPMDTGLSSASAPVQPRAVDGISPVPSLAAQPTASPTAHVDSEPRLAEPAMDLVAATPQPVFAPDEEAPSGGIAASPDVEPQTSPVMNSPFLPDAKVEKRPLGAPLGDLLEETPMPSDADSGASVAEPTDENDTTIEAAPAELPEELRSDVLSLESHDTAVEAQSATQADTEQASVAPEAASTIAETAQSPVQPMSQSPSLVSALPPRQAPPVSVEDSEEPKQSIFDTDDTQPMKHQPKRSSGWMTVVIIGSILLVGIVGGVIFYLLNNGY